MSTSAFADFSSASAVGGNLPPCCSTSRAKGKLSPNTAAGRASLREFPLNRLILRIAKRFQVAIDATRIPCDAHPPPVPNQLVRKLNPFVFRNHPHQVFFDLSRIFVFRQVQPARQPNDMSIHHHSARNPVRRPQHHVSRFSRHARQCQNLLHRPRHLPTEILDDPFACSHD